MVGNTTILTSYPPKIKRNIWHHKFFAICRNYYYTVVVGDLYQLPPIHKRFVFDCYKNDSYNLCHPWKVLKMIELDKITRQKNDQAFVQLLKRIRTGSQTEDDIKIIQSTSLSPSETNYPSDALHIWAENAPVDEHNKNKLE